MITTNKKFLVCVNVFFILFQKTQCFITPSWSFGRDYSVRCSSKTQLDAAVGIFYGTSTGNTMDCAEKIFQAFGGDNDEIVAEPVDIDTIDSDKLAAMFAQHNALIVGTPTWNTGADTQRSGTGWDEIYYTKLPSMKDALAGKTVAVFGLGDQSSYSSNFADATGELYDVFTAAGCNMIDASWSTDGYEHEESKSIRDGKFCGLILDMINQEELTDERIEKWVQQLTDNGILNQTPTTSSSTSTSTNEVTTTKPEEEDEGVAVSVPTTTTTTTIPVNDMSIQDIEERIMQLQGEITMLQISLAEKVKLQSPSHDDFTPHYNPVTRKTMWTSPDGRKSYFTSDLKP